MPTTRERIIEATTELFMQRGYSASGLKDISKAGAAPIGSLYHFFPGGKEELAAETLRSSGAAYQALVEAVFGGPSGMGGGVRARFQGPGGPLPATPLPD